MPCHLSSPISPDIPTDTRSSRNMAPPRSCHRRNALSRPHGHVWRHLPPPSHACPPNRYSKHLRPPRPCLLGLDRVRHISLDLRDERLALRRSPRSHLHGHYTRLHLSQCGRELRQRGNRHLSARLHLLSLDQGGKSRQYHVGCPDGVVLWIHGQRVGWIRLHHQLAAAACFCADLHGAVQSKVVRQLHDLVCVGHVGEYADSVCGLPAD